MFKWLIGLALCASLWVQPAEAAGSCSLQVVALRCAIDGTKPTAWVATRNGVALPWPNPLLPINLQDGDVVYLRYQVTSQDDTGWRALSGIAYDPFADDYFFCYGTMPSWRWINYWKVRANCTTDSYWFEQWHAE